MGCFSMRFILQCVRPGGKMATVSCETFMSSMSRDVLEDWLAVLFQENKAKLESQSSTYTEV